MAMQLPKIIAHRGASSQAPENTLSAFKLAKQRGNRWVEFDVQLSADHIPIVFHDNTLERTSNGHGYIYQTPYDQLKILDAGNWFSSKYAGEPIPKFTEVLDFLIAENLYANIEIKDCPDALQNEKTAQIVAKTLQNYQTESTRFLISSFSWNALAKARELLPSHPMAMLLDIQDWQNDWYQQDTHIAEVYRQLQCLSININQNALSKERIAEIHKISPHILAYTVNDPNRMTQLLSWGISGVFSDSLTSI